MLKVAVVGAGYIGQLHANIIAENIDYARVVAVVDPIPDKGRQLAESVGAKYYSCYDTMLSEADVDTVAICTPTFLHAEMVAKAAHGGKNIFCEKPLAVSIEQADQMVDAVRAAGVNAMAGHVLRFWPEYVRVKEIADGGELGKPVHGFFERLAVIPDWTEADWNREEHLGGGAGLDLQIHDIDFASWLFGDAQSLNAQGVYDSDLGGWAHMGTSISFESGQSALVQGGWAFPLSFPFTMTARVLCERGAIEWLFRAGKNIEERGTSVPIIIYLPNGKIHEERVEAVDPYLMEWLYFTDCVASGTKIQKATFEDARVSLSLALASQTSAAQSGARITF
jgi:predicted dehydrogenase